MLYLRNDIFLTDIIDYDRLRCSKIYTLNSCRWNTRYTTERFRMSTN